MDASEYSARLSAIVLSSEDAIISKTLDGIINSWNPAAEIIFGYTAEEAIGKHISLIIPEELLSEEDFIIARIKRGQRISHYETVRKRKDGSKLHVAVTVSPIKDKNDRIIGASKIARDITDLKTGERNTAMLAAIIDSSYDAIVSKNLDGIITSWNKGAERIFGYTPDEATGKSISIIIPEYKLPEEAEIIQKIRRGERVNHFDTIRKRKDGKEINISVTISPVRDKSGKIIGASKIARDITERVELEQQRILFTKKLQELNDYKDEFMAMTSHELKTPLTVIKANLQMLEYTLDDNVKTKLLNATVANVNKLSNLISDLLDVSKIQTGKVELKFTNFEMNEFLCDIIKNIQQTSPSHEIIFNCNNEKLPACGDTDRLEQVVINILINAIKYSPDKKIIIVDAGVKDNQIVVEVKDEGIGIPPGDMDKIFTRFFRVPGLASTFSGSGIGLYISSEIVKRHGGNIWVESELQKGSTFYFSIPLLPANTCDQ